MLYFSKLVVYNTVSVDCKLTQMKIKIVSVLTPVVKRVKALTILNFASHICLCSVRFL